MNRKTQSIIIIILLLLFPGIDETCAAKQRTAHHDILPPGVVGVLYHPTMVPRVHGTLGTPYTPVVHLRHGRTAALQCSAAERCPGLRAAFSSRVGTDSKRACALEFLYLRLVSPGHPDRR